MEPLRKYSSTSKSNTKKKTIDKKKKVKKCDEPNPEKSYRGLGKKIIIFAHHRTVLDSIQDMLNDMSILYVRVDGKDDQKKKKTAIDQFQKDDETGK